MVLQVGRRAVMGGLMGGGALLASFGPGAAFAAPGTENPYLRYVHPDLRAAAAALMPLLAQAPPLSNLTLPNFRQGGEARNQPPLATVPWQRKQIAGLGGQPAVTVYVVNPLPGGRRPAILHTHGGGYVMGSAVSAVPMLQQLTQQLDAVAVSVEYRLAPETTYRGSVEDNYAGLKWLHDHADELGADPARIAVMGESAGGGHAALLAIAARNRGEVPLAFQCLIYPMLDDRTGSTRQVPPHVGKIVWDAVSNRFGWSSFLGTAAGGPSAPAAGVPARIANLAGLPPAFIGVGSIDLFHDEDVDYAQRLNQAGVPTELIVVPGAFHGFDGSGGSTSIGRWFNAAKVDALRRGLGVPLPA